MVKQGRVSGVLRCMALALFLLVVARPTYAGDFLMRYDQAPTRADRTDFPTVLRPGEAELRRVAGDQYKPYHVCLRGGELIYCASGEPLIGAWSVVDGQYLFTIDLQAHRQHMRRGRVHTARAGRADRILYVQE